MWKYPNEVGEYIKLHSQEMSIDDMALKVNELFGTEFTYEKMKAYYSNHKLKTGVRRQIYTDLWPKEVCEFVYENYKGRTHKGMVQLLKDTYGREYTPAQIKSFYANRKLDSGMTGRFEKGQAPKNKGKTWDEYMSKEAQEKASATWFAKNHEPDNKVPLGTIIVGREGYLKIKVTHKGSQWERWKFLHRQNWEEAYGPIPKGMVVTFKDGDRNNCDVSNLMLITKAQNAVMIKKQLRFSDPELTEAGANIAGLIVATRKRK